MSHEQAMPSSHAGFRDNPLVDREYAAEAADDADFAADMAYLDQHIGAVMADWRQRGLDVGQINAMVQQFKLRLHRHAPVFEDDEGMRQRLFAIVDYLDDMEHSAKTARETAQHAREKKADDDLFWQKKFEALRKWIDEPLQQRPAPTASSSPAPETTSLDLALAMKAVVASTFGAATNRFVMAAPGQSPAPSASAPAALAPERTAWKVKGGLGRRQMVPAGSREPQTDDATNNEMWDGQA